MARVDFIIATRQGDYMDTILFPDEAPMTEEDLEAEKQRRADAWIAFIETPAEPEA